MGQVRWYLAGLVSLVGYGGTLTLSVLRLRWLCLCPEAPVRAPVTVSRSCTICRSGHTFLQLIIEPSFREPYCTKNNWRHESIQTNERTPVTPLSFISILEDPSCVVFTDAVLYCTVKLFVSSTLLPRMQVTAHEAIRQPEHPHLINHRWYCLREAVGHYIHESEPVSEPVNRRRKPALRAVIASLSKYTCSTLSVYVVHTRWVCSCLAVMLGVHIE